MLTLQTLPDKEAPGRQCEAQKGGRDG